MKTNALKLSSHEISVLDDVLLYKFDSEYDYGLFFDEVKSEIESGNYPDNLKKVADLKTPWFKKHVYEFFTYHHEPDKYSNKTDEGSYTISSDHIRVGNAHEKSEHVYKISKYCQICDGTFEVFNINDPRVICPSCKEKLNKLIKIMM